VNTAYLLITLIFAAMVAFSGLGKIRRDPRIVHVVHEVVGVPLKYFSLLAACELAGALRLVLGIWLPWTGQAASVGLVISICSTCHMVDCGRLSGIPRNLADTRSEIQDL
jgi:uncharacterized membrane protein YphA (DoxX/SURF4 family)